MNLLHVEYTFYNSSDYNTSEKSNKSLCAESKQIGLVWIDGENVHMGVQSIISVHCVAVLTQNVV